MDLLDWRRGRLSSRRLAVLVRHLPRSSATLRALHGESVDWSATDHLLAAAVDQLAEANWMFATVHRDEDAEPLEYPRPVPRPGSRGEVGGEAGGGDSGGDSGSGAEPDPSGGLPGPRDRTAPAPARNPTPAELARFFTA
ncbi:hypothetical protein AB0O01_12995 [Streptomyces sp. NPDC093252]|uniref:hypothetical protein n=1 Tax=Streptomyces sp. NPDC093252 TaxID=3154980 RepID=UPI003417D48E